MLYRKHCSNAQKTRRTQRTCPYEQTPCCNVSGSTRAAGLHDEEQQVEELVRRGRLVRRERGQRRVLLAGELDPDVDGDVAAQKVGFDNATQAWALAASVDVEGAVHYALRRGDHSEAQRLIGERLREVPDCQIALELRALERRAFGDNAAAARFYDEAAAVATGDAKNPALLRSALGRAANDDLAGAQRVFEDLCQGSDDAEVWREYGFFLDERLNDRARAVAALKRAVKLDPSEGQARAQLAKWGALDDETDRTARLDDACYVHNQTSDWPAEFKLAAAWGRGRFAYLQGRAEDATKEWETVATMSGQLQHRPMLAEVNLEEPMHASLAKMARPMGAAFQPHMAQLLPLLLEAAGVVVETTVEEVEEVKEEDEDANIESHYVELKTGGYTRVCCNVAQMQEKVLGVGALFEYAQALGSS